MSGGLYVHVPWCRAICPYCAFAVRRDTSDTPWQAFVDRVLREAEQRADALNGLADTAFLGGGTPSRLPPAALARLLAGLPIAEQSEISAEVNPEDATIDWLSAAHRAGVTRISLGVQTFDPRFAKLLGRGHTSPQAAEAIRRIAAGGFASWSVDLMFALPGQTLADLERDLDALLRHDPPHVSLYGLTFEPDTPFERRRKSGRLKPPPDNLWRQMYDRIVERFSSAGLERYEVSNFARAGHRCAHNLGYWTGRPYLGLGPAAHGLAADGRRWSNLADPAAYLAADDPTLVSEQPTGEELAIDRLLTAMRCVDGIDLTELATQTGWAPDPASIEALTSGGLLRADGTRIALSDQGFPVADSVVGRLIATLRGP